jgi:hypothetical protein
MSIPPKNPADHQALIEDFRAYLQTVITAEQFGQSARLAALPGSKTENYCLSLAKLPDNTLAAELVAPVWAILEQINQTAMEFHRPLYHKQISDPAERAKYERVLAQLDFALALILRRLPGIARFRAKSTKCSDLLCEVAREMTSHGAEVTDLIRRWQKEFPDDAREADGSLADGGFPDIFAWDTYQRVEALDRLADEYPEHVRLAAREMHGWPMLVHRHTANRKRFQALAARLELGVDYPLDASEGARFRPDTPLVQYLDALVYRVNYVRSFTANASYESVEKEREALRRWWWDGDDERPGEDVVEALRAVSKLPPLTKATAIEWAEKAIVPVILATAARDWKNCDEPVLRRIAKQAGVKSRATFKSRLLSPVSATLRRLARPA